MYDHPIGPTPSLDMIRNAKPPTPVPNTYTVQINGIACRYDDDTRVTNQDLADEFFYALTTTSFYTIAPRPFPFEPHFIRWMNPNIPDHKTHSSVLLSFTDAEDGHILKVLERAIHDFNYGVITSHFHGRVSMTIRSRT
ncbi:hypothetical protein WOLCODRAFT_137145 [Wolfiporia cocos MD-104 SS10]|uniref:Uncharacterized protein n=1 Tax=Wolfiporia cocos (strain MD-104) TaxID=742152 RepID=A0A2H3JQF3_WOLCO|nr:hypothetical protein WOLCODRAFT_137145 [Wolfiporia cocos MD-104 SS10]